MFELDLLDLTCNLIIDPELSLTIIRKYSANFSVISRRQSYIDLVFEGDIPSPVGQFIEDNFSGHVMSLLREDFDKYAEFG